MWPEALTLLLTATVLSSLVMAVVWLISNRIRNAGIVDVAWAGLFTILALLYAVAGSGAPNRRLLIAAMMILWSLRLTLHLGRRVLGHLDIEDGRYAQLRSSWGARADLRMFWFFQLQAVTNVLFSVPALLASIDPSPSLGLAEWAGVAIWFVALAGEAAADAQLRAFKRNPATQGQVCMSGLWRYSRHPNYFFEWLVWVAFFLFALGSPLGWIAVACPVVMLLFLYKVTGIPATEEQAVRTKGEAYRRYQRTTSPFIPWFPKSEGGAA